MLRLLFQYDVLLEIADCVVNMWAHHGQIQRSKQRCSERNVSAPMVKSIDSLCPMTGSILFRSKTPVLHAFEVLLLLKLPLRIFVGKLTGEKLCWFFSYALTRFQSKIINRFSIALDGNGCCEWPDV